MGVPGFFVSAQTEPVISELAILNSGLIAFLTAIDSIGVVRGMTPPPALPRGGLGLAQVC